VIDAFVAAFWVPRRAPPTAAAIDSSSRVEANQDAGDLAFVGTGNRLREAEKRVLTIAAGADPLLGTDKVWRLNRCAARLPGSNGVAGCTYRRLCTSSLGA
jgi:hypothetical protein